jgi:hypothetical protein
MLGPDASLNTEADCVTAVNASPITTEMRRGIQMMERVGIQICRPKILFHLIFMTMRRAVPSFPNQISVASMATIRALLMT